MKQSSGRQKPRTSHIPSSSMWRLLLLWPATPRSRIDGETRPVSAPGDAFAVDVVDHRILLVPSTSILRTSMRSCPSSRIMVDSFQRAR